MKSPVHVLYLEDEVNDVELARARLLQAEIDHEIVHVETRDDFNKALDQQALDLILADFSLPSFDGLTALAIAKKRRPDVPFILVSGQVGEELAIDSLKAGATDYVLKQRLSRLVPAVRRALSEAEEHRQRLLAEGELRRLATAIDQAAETIVVTDVEGTIQYVNPAFERVTGFGAEEAVGQNARILKSGKQDAALYEDLWNTISAGEVWSGRLTNMKKDGSLYVEDATISPVRDDSGRIINYVAVKRDITERAVLERRLRQAQKLEALGTLAGGVAHDFNNILAAIIGFTELVDERLPEESSEHEDLNQALVAAHRAKDLVKQILTFSRRREQECQPVYLHHTIKEVLELMSPALPATIEILRTVDEQCGPVNADPTQMHQVIMNLCTNAYHAMKDTGGTLALDLATVDVDENLAASTPGLHKGTRARLTVQDTGYGMNKETLSRIFDPFYTTKEEGEGTGLGLSTVHGIVKACGGDITVESSLGQGARFQVYLPLSETATREERAEDGPIQGGSERILIVDDEEFLVELMGRQLKSLGYEVTVTTSSIEALEKLRARPHHFDLIITDNIMPKMTGAELIREVKTLRNDIPVISVTGRDKSASHEQDQNSSARTLLKPFGFRMLAQSVRETLDNARTTEAPSAAGKEGTHSSCLEAQL